MSIDKNLLQGQPFRLVVLLFIVLLTVFLTARPTSGFAQSNSARALFADNKAGILQIRIIDITSGSKSAIGSGFVVNDSGLIATNYHVVQMAASKPEQYRIEYLSADGAAGSLNLVDVDIINDLALVQRRSQGSSQASKPLAAVLPLAAAEPDIGVAVYALGNPLDLGLTVVPGTYNGINQSSYHPRVHFTGSLNSGMSGGPTLNQAGEVVGINVSTAGNQVSFLVPVTALQHLIAEHQLRGQGVDNMALRIGQQLLADQDKKFAQMLSLDWSTIALGEATVVNELSPFFRCWGGSNSSSEKAQLLSADRTCRSEDNIYLNEKFNSGVIEHQFFWLEADKLNPLQFYTYYKRLFSDFAPGNKAREKDVGDYQCDTEFVATNNLEAEPQRKTKAVFCARAYKDYPQLYDVLFLQGTVHESRAAFISHFTLAGVSRDNAKAYARKFMGVAQWR
ncbi:serine protease [Porticoccaceae bacterium]|nr:serine protease [Porticoccaceae bacterium]